MKHSNYSPSRLTRILNCPGSVELCKAHVQENGESTSEAASLGTHRHDLTDVALSSDLEKIRPLCKDEDDYPLVEECVELRNSLVMAASGSWQEQLETKVSLTQYGFQDVWGTLDYGLYDSLNFQIDIVDWKFGYNLVDAFKNPQLLSYAAGFIAYLGMPPVKKIRCHIFQPTRESHSIYELTMPELLHWIHGTLAHGIIEASYSDKLVPGEAQCQWCEARSQCIARFEMAQETAARIFELRLLAEKKLMSADELAKVYTEWTQLESFMKDMYAYGLRELDKGREFPGYKLIQGSANRKWVNEDAAGTWVTENLEDDAEIYVSKLKSIAQLEKADKTLKKNAEFKKLFFVPPGKITMVGEEDKRKAITPSKDVETVFDEFKIG